MENQKNQDSSNAITFADITISSSSLFTMVDTTIVSSNIDFTIDTTSNSYIFTYDDNNSTAFTSYNDPYRELEESKQQQEKEEELRKENSCLQEAWNEYQLILKLLEENECDKFVEKRYGVKK